MCHVTIDLCPVHFPARDGPVIDCKPYIMEVYNLWSGEKRMLLGYTSGRNSSPRNSEDNLVPRPPLDWGLGTRLFGRCARVDMWSGHVTV